MKALILAAGYATRLHPLTESTPKCLLMIGGRTLLDTLCEKLVGVESVDEILIVTNAKFYDQLDRWRARSRCRLPIRLLNDGTRSNETRLGALGDMGFVVRSAGIESDLFLMASDNLFDQDLEDFVNFAQSKKESVTIAVYDLRDPKLAAGKFGVIELGPTGQMISLEEKPKAPKSSLIGMGLYYFPKNTLRFVQEYLSSPEAQDAPGFYIRWLSTRVKIFGFLFGGAWYDIGDLKALEEAKKIFVQK